MITISPPTTIRKLGAIGQRFRAFRMACSGLLRDEDGDMTPSADYKVGMPCMLVIVVGLAVVLASAKGAAWLLWPGLSMLFIGAAVAFLVYARPNNRVLEKAQYDDIQAILCSYPQWRSIVANWVVANDGFLDMRHLRALRRAIVRQNRACRWNSAMSGDNNPTARTMLGDEMSTFIDEAALAQSTQPAANNERHLPRI